MKQKELKKRPVGRPSKYSDEIADIICERISTSNRGLHTICKADDMPGFSTVFKWLNEPDKYQFVDKYARAREAQAEFLKDEMIEISDNSSNDSIISDTGEIPNTEWIQRSRLRVDTRKWVASKLAPKKFGDKLDVTSGGEKIKQPQIIVQDEVTKKALENLRPVKK